METIMETIIENNTDFNFDNEYKKIIDNIFLCTLETLGYNNSLSISILITNNDEIKYLNKKYRKIDKATDVLSFPQYEKDQLVKLKQTSNLFLGDVVLSMEKAISQSEQYGHSIKREVAFLVTHSILHLLGYDHMSTEDENEMFALQESILNKIGLVR